MSNIFQSLITLFEIMAIGVFAIGILMYILLTFHPLLYFTLKYATSLTNAITTSIKELEIWYRSTPKTSAATETPQQQRPLFGFGEFHPFNVLQLLGFLGLLYFSGSVANIATYAFLKTSDEKIIGWLYGEIQSQKGKRFFAKDSLGFKVAYDERFDAKGKGGGVYPIQYFSGKADQRPFEDYFWEPINNRLAAC